MTMHLDKNTGLVSKVTYLASPNQDPRPVLEDINALVIHAISLPPDQFGGEYIEQLFTNCLDPVAHPYFTEIHHLRVSSHFLIRRDGQIVQFVPTTERAWHAGESCFQGRHQVNDFSIGIELEGCDTESFARKQYAQLGLLTEAIVDAYPLIARNRITGHSDISPGRKTDPGPCFDWDRYRRLISIESER